VIEWLAWTMVAIALAQAFLAIGYSLAGSPPNDYTLGATLLIALLLVVQVVISVWQQVVAGQTPSGDAVEYWAYLITAVVLPPAAIVWGVIERSRWSTLVLALVGFSIAVMVYRMHHIWFVQVA
jgi:hypothetical protein